ncbi:MAG TPA: isocitrate lyase/phosphoenolpyruvate mutase family protein, partial [Candidatus Acidoferrales bacterium]|nr:isocitrate lyase/phosphoenolpyruvate mutase family protein [Candidatus Acidoferrales bacterium]
KLGEIERLAAQVKVPVNVYALRGVPSVPELAEAGVARVSVGCGPLQAALGLMRRIAAELQGRGTYNAFSDGALSAREINEMMG